MAPTSLRFEEQAELPPLSGHLRLQLADDAAVWDEIQDGRHGRAKSPRRSASEIAHDEPGIILDAPRMTVN